MARRIRIVEAPSEAKVIDRVASEIDQLLKEGFSRSKIAVVSVVGQGKEGGVATLDRIGTHQLVRADDPAMEESVIGDTFLRVKGLERPAVIITDLSRIAESRSSTLPTRMHIAVTRALSALRVVDTRDALIRDAAVARLGTGT